MRRRPTLRALGPLAALLAAGACADQASLPTTPTAAPGAPQRSVTTPSYEEAMATVVDGETIDANRDGTGDGTIDDAGLVSALNDDLNGQVYVHWEWDISTLTRPVLYAKVRLTVKPGNLTNMDMGFFAATGDGDGALTPADFNTAVAPVASSLPVPLSPAPATVDAANVTDALNAAIAAKRHYFVLQGRIPDGFEGGSAQIYTSASFNPDDYKPKLLFLRPTNTSPTITAAPAPGAAVEGSAVSFGASATDPDGDALTYTWSFGDGSTATGGAVTHAYVDNGTYAVTVVASDGRLADTARTTATITNAPPAVTAPATATAAPKTTYALQAAFADAGAQDGPWTYVVSWGDGSAATSGQQTTQGPVAASHTYAKQGTYTIAVRVTDKDGAAGTAATRLTVAQPKGKK